MNVKKGKIIITTHHFQKTGLDPITEWEKKNFKVSDSGDLVLIEHLFKKVGSDEWKTDEEWYKR